MDRSYQQKQCPPGERWGCGENGREGERPENCVSAFAGMAGVTVAAGLYFYRYLVQNIVDWDLFAIVLTIAAVWSLFTIVVMKLLSILMRSSGRRLTCASDA